MGIATSIFLLTVGAIMRFAVNVDTKGFDIHTAGVILMVTGALGLLLALMFWESWWGGWPGVRRRRRVIDDDF
jgi:hypothetical protein